MSMRFFERWRKILRGRVSQDACAPVHKLGAETVEMRKEIKSHMKKKYIESL